MINLNILNKPVYIVGDKGTVLNMSTLAPLQPFEGAVVEFLNKLSHRLLKAKTGYSDVSTFAFWCRKAHIISERDKYSERDSRLGRGIIFHSTPSNVAVNFAFSFVAGLLAGNANIVRLPAKSFAQVDIICNAINKLLEEDEDLKPYICMLKFAPDAELYDVFSSMCDCRVIWGGDHTIAELRNSKLPPRANEITFSDRFSVLIINADQYIENFNKSGATEDFYNDTFLTDQNACTSPRIILWYGNRISEAKLYFWEAIQKKAEKYSLQPVQAVGKLSAFYSASVSEDITRTPSTDNVITRVKVNKLTPTLMDHKYNSGFFYEYDVKNFSELRCLFTKPCQTLSYIGFQKEELHEMLMGIRPLGVDRIVPVGKTMDFSLIWDGNDLIRSMSRVIDLV